MWENVFTFDVFSWMKFDVGSILISKRGKIETRWVWGSAFFRLAIYSQLIRIGGTYWLLRFMDIDLNAPCAVVSRLPKIQSNSHFPFDMWRRMCNIPNILPNKPHTRTHHSLCKRHLLSFNRFLICLMEKVDKWIWSERLLCEKRVNM